MSKVDKNGSKLLLNVLELATLESSLKSMLTKCEVKEFATNN